ncbi:Putative sulfur deprivation response regulator [Durusdinium trenchii]
MEPSSPHSPVTPMRSFRTGRSYVLEMCSARILVLCMCAISTTLFVGFRAEHDPEWQKLFEVCETGPGRKVRCHSNPWQALLVGNVLLVATTMMISGYRSHHVFLAAVTFLGSTGMISTEQALAGFSSSGNIAFQAVLLLVAGIQDSGVLDHIFSRMLGTRETHTKAFVRVQVVTALLGAMVQQTTVVVAAAPALQRWAPRAGWSVREVLLPVSTVGAVSQNLVIVTSTVALTIYQTMPEAQLEMLDPALVCIALTSLTIVYCTLLAKPLLSAMVKEPHLDNREHMRHQCHNRYYLSFEVAKGSFLIDSTIAQAGLLFMPGASLVDSDFPLDQQMLAGNRLNFAATAAGVAQIRNRSPGLVLQGVDTLAVLGAQRHRRRLFEVGIAPGSSLVG